MAETTLEDAVTRSMSVDRAKRDATTEDDIRRSMIEDGFDPDDPSYLDGAVIIRPPRAIRERLGMTQATFADAISSQTTRLPRTGGAQRNPIRGPGQDAAKRPSS